MELTDGCYSGGDSQGLPGFIHPVVLGIQTMSFQLKLYSQRRRCRVGVWVGGGAGCIGFPGSMRDGSEG